MQQVLSQMLLKYQINNIEDKKNAIKEIVQEIVLCGLSRGGLPLRRGGQRDVSARSGRGAGL